MWENFRGESLLPPFLFLFHELSDTDTQLFSNNVSHQTPPIYLLRPLLKNGLYSVPYVGFDLIFALFHLFELPHTPLPLLDLHPELFLLLTPLGSLYHLPLPQLHHLLISILCLILAVTQLTNLILQELHFCIGFLV